MNEKLHFKIIASLSVLVVVLNFGFLSLWFQSANPSIKESTPIIQLVGGGGVEIKSIFDPEYQAAVEFQDVLNQSTVRTLDGLAEIKMGPNQVYLSTDTEIKLLGNDEERWLIELKHGKLRVMAYQTIVIRSESGDLELNQSIGGFSKKEGAYVAEVFSGKGDLTVKNQRGNELNQLTIPMQHQVSFHESQLVPAYEKLQYSKLGKELKLQILSQENRENGWYRARWNESMIGFQGNDQRIQSTIAYQLKKWAYQWKNWLGRDKNSQENKQAWIEDQMNYVLGKLSEKNNLNKTDDILARMVELDLTLSNDDRIQLWKPVLNEIRYVEPNSVTEKAKEWLKGRLLRQETEMVMQSYLHEAEWAWGKNQNEYANQIIQKWLGQWNLVKKNRDEQVFIDQARQFNRMLLVYADRINDETLQWALQAGEARLLNTTDEDDVFEVAQERLDLTKQLVANYRYKEAENYLKNGYEKLTQIVGDTSRAAIDVFTKEGAFLADRITFANQNLRGAATPIDEGAFQAYLKQQEKDQTISNRFNQFIGGGEEETTVIISVEEVETELRKAGLNIQISNISESKEPQQFTIMSATLIVDGRQIEFAGQYDAISKTMSQITRADGLEIKGNFALSDLSTVMKQESRPENTENPSIDPSYWEQEGEGDRVDIVEQDLAKKLALGELNQFGINPPNSRSMVLTDPITLDEFALKDVIIRDEASQRSVKASFNYKASTKAITNIVLEDHEDIILEEPVALEQLVPSLLNAIQIKEERDTFINGVVKRFQSYPVELTSDQIELKEGELNTVTLKGVKLKMMPINFDAVYDYEKDRFIEATHPDYSGTDLAVETYLRRLASNYVIKLMEGEQITITTDNIQSDLPDNEVTLENIERENGLLLSLTINVNTKELRNILNQSTSETFPRMTFSQLRAIKLEPKTEPEAAPQN